MLGCLIYLYKYLLKAKHCTYLLTCVFPLLSLLYFGPNGYQDWFSVIWRTLMAVALYTYLRYLWWRFWGVQKMNFRNWIFENENFLALKWHYTYFLNMVNKELGEKNQVEKDSIFCFHFLNAPAIFVFRLIYWSTDV